MIKNVIAAANLLHEALNWIGNKKIKLSLKRLTDDNPVVCLNTRNSHVSHVIGVSQKQSREEFDVVKPLGEEVRVHPTQHLNE